MFLSTPSIEELQSLELSALIDMLVEETVAYIKLIERDGFSHKSNACMEVIINLQVAIETRQNLEKNQPGISQKLSSQNKTSL